MELRSREMEERAIDCRHLAMNCGGDEQLADKWQKLADEFIALAESTATRRAKSFLNVDDFEGKR
jgi:hypothetical protein